MRHSMIDSRFASLLRAEMQRLEISKADLSSRLDVDRSHVSHILDGKLLSPGGVDKIADALQATPEQRREMHIAAARDKGYGF